MKTEPLIFALFVACTVCMVASFVLFCAASSYPKSGQLTVRNVYCASVKLERITVPVGSMIRLDANRLPVVPRFLDAEAKFKLEGDATLRLIGVLRLPSEGEGGSVLTGFFLACNPGKTQVHLTVLDSDKQIVEESDVIVTVE